ncbi:hypothetical protein [Candidatus Nesciobacter abundans]|uniref:Uncharacterized protein n=1 Tax=Candidatus Nesciobacter abundans TaxID=2601668 RepID=A0A5C0UJF9_9PROT|nr:hypothetical protein [Candidatus Nesciobacter abundans]QEK38944.1 hypothetical protein FZC36_00630 [Candidatus Nesciobacter abundans]
MNFTMLVSILFLSFLSDIKAKPTNSLKKQAGFSEKEYKFIFNPKGHFHYLATKDMFIKFYLLKYEDFKDSFGLQNLYEFLSSSFDKSVAFFDFSKQENINHLAVIKDGNIVGYSAFVEKIKPSKKEKVPSTYLFLLQFVFSNDYVKERMFKEIAIKYGHAKKIVTFIRPVMKSSYNFIKSKKIVPLSTEEAKEFNLSKDMYQKLIFKPRIFKQQLESNKKSLF